MTTIKDLKKGDKFRFNGIIYTVRRKFIVNEREDKPLIAYDELCQRSDFWWEGLEIEKL
jgi:hypothetical protein